MPELTLSRLKELMSYSPETGEFVRLVTRSGPGSRAGTIPGWVDQKGYRRIEIAGKTYIAHRLAWFYVYGAWPAEEIDHINRIKSDNRISNLRVCTTAQNAQNKPPPVPTKNFRGGKWKATIRVDRKRISLGSFTTQAEAQQAINTAKPTIHPFYGAQP